mgnify:CR=1 FL=1
MKKQILTIIVSMMFAFATSIANAGSFNVGVTGALAKVSASGTETTGAGASGAANTNSASVENDNVPIGSVFAEYQSDFYGLTLGVEHIPGRADVSESVKQRSDIEASVTGDTTTNTGARAFKANAEVENYNLIYVELPIYNQLFVGAGLSEIDVNTTEVASSNGGSYGNKTLDGEMYRIGVKGAIGDNAGYKLFYEANDFDTLKLTSTGNSVAAETNSISADLDVDMLKFALSYNF